MNKTGIIFKMSRSPNQKFKSNRAADEALRKMSLDLVEQLNLFETTLYLHKSNGLTPLEMEKLGNCYTTELERKQYLVLTVIPSKGHYRGMRLLRRALKQSKQYKLYNSLKKAYEEAVDAVIAEKLRLPQPESKVKHEAGASYPEETASDLYDSITFPLFNDANSLNPRYNLNRPTSPSTSSSSSDASDDDIISLDPPAEQQPLPSYVDVKLEVAFPQGRTTTISLSYPPHRLRSNDISGKSNPYNYDDISYDHDKSASSVNVI